MASLILGTAANQLGCFVPDLTRSLGTACEGTRQDSYDIGIRRYLQKSPAASDFFTFRYARTASRVLLLPALRDSTAVTAPLG